MPSPTNYDFGDLATKWEVDQVTTRISSQTKEAVQVGVRAAANGLPVNPTADVVEFAFLATTDNPTSGDWHAGSWDTSVIGTYVAQAVVGPGSSWALAAGEYYAWVRVTDAGSGEIVVRMFGKLLVE